MQFSIWIEFPNKKAFSHRGEGFWLFIRKRKATRLGCFSGAGNQNRTDDLVITNDVLYRLSHTSISLDYDIIPNKITFVKGYFEIF